MKPRRLGFLFKPANIGLGLVAVLFVVNLSVSEWNVRHLIRNEHRVAYAQEVLTTLEEVLDGVTRAETAERGFLITRDSSYLSSHERAVRATAETLEKLTQLVGDDALQLSRLAFLQGLIRERFDELAVAIALQQGEGFEAARRSVSNNRGKRLMRQLRDLVGEMQNLERQALAARAQESRRSATVTTVCDLLGAAMGLGTVCAAFFLFRRELAHRVRAEEATRRLAAIVESSDDAIMGLTLEGVIVSWNAGSRRIYGFMPEEMIGKSVLALSVPDRLDELRLNLERVRDGARIEHFETAWLHKNGRRIDVSLIISPIKDAADAVIGVSAISHDITERKLLRREVLDIAASEQRRIGQDLHDGAGQELTGLAMLAERLAGDLAGQSLPHANAAYKIGDGLGKVLGHIRALSRGLAPVEIDGDGLMAALAELALRTQELHNIHCAFYCDEPVRVLDNQAAMHLYRLSQEAVTNAIKHGAPRSIVISLATDGNLITLTIADNGRGFAKLPQKPTGAGLRIMRYRAELIGASLTLTPGPRQGAVLTCTLPQRSTALCALPNPRRHDSPGMLGKFPMAEC